MMARLEQDMITFESEDRAKCATEERRTGRKAMTHEEFVRKIAEHNGSLEVIGQYVNAKTKIKIRCRICGQEWETRPGDAYRISCAKCNGFAQLTHDEFVQKVRANPKNDSLIILGTYEGSQKKVLCKCSRCGDERTFYPSALYNGIGCQRCHNTSRNAPKFFEKMAQRHPTIEISGEYIDYKSIFHCKCMVCKTEWDATGYTLSQMRKCKFCAGKLLTHEMFIKRLGEINPTVEALGKYQNVKTPIECRCRICGHKWSTRPSVLLAKDHPGACPECGKKKAAFVAAEAARRKRKTHEEFLTEMAERAPTITVIGQYKDTSTKVSCLCNICNHEWASVPQCLLNNGCPQCASQRRADFFRKPREQLIKELAVVNPGVCLVGEYVNDGTKTEFQCVRCRHIWTTTAASILRQRSGCPECSNKQTSFVEKTILLFLRKTLGTTNVTSRDRSIGRELDVYAKSKKIAVEYGSWYWHKDRVAEDKERLKLCHQLGIDLIIIYDSFDDNVEDFDLSDDAFVIYRKPLSALRMREELKTCIKNIYRRFNLTYSFSEEEEDKLFTQAKLVMARKTTEDVVNELFEVNPDVELLDKYKDTQTPMLCRCRKCWHQWSATYNSLIRQKSKCPICSHRHKRVVNLDTGETFESARAASLHFGLKDWAVKHACRKPERAYKGQHWTYLENLSQSQIEELRKQYQDTFKY